MNEAGADGSSVVTRAPVPSIYPTLRLSSGTHARGAEFRIRPLALEETVPAPPGLSDDIEEQWLKGSWVLEYVKASEVEDGLVVRQTWLSEKPREGETSWDGLFRVEHLLVSTAYGDQANTSFGRRPIRQPATAGACLSHTRQTLCIPQQERMAWSSAGQ